MSYKNQLKIVNTSNQNYIMNRIERNIIVGSLLGDGNLALYGRSVNAYYREHGCDKQISYRQWKADKLSNLDFKYDLNCTNPTLRSPSNPIYTDLYNRFYRNKIKIVTEENIKLLDHPIGLACLYADDGTLIVEASKRSENKLYLFPRIYIYSLSFTKEENQILITHIKNCFDVEFKLKHRKDGKNYILELNKRNELMKFINIVKPYISEVPCMKYKINIEQRLKEKSDELQNCNPNKKILMCDLKIEDTHYSKKDEELIIELKKNTVPDKQIAETLNKTYYGIVDKIRRLRKEGRII